jgi:hypothetical protein
MVRTTYRAAAMEWRTILSVGWLDNGFVAPQRQDRYRNHVAICWRRDKRMIGLEAGRLLPLECGKSSCPWPARELFPPIIRLLPD